MAQAATAERKNEIAPIHIEEPRLPYRPKLEEVFGVSKASWRILCNVIYPSATSIEGILLAVRYCKDRNLDILKKPVHIVPIYSKAKRGYVESVWPGINEYRTTAQRSTDRPYAGCDATEFGPMVEKTFEGVKEKWEGDKGSRRKVGTETISVTLKFPEWARVTVYRLVGGQKCAFHGPRVKFEETFSPIGFGTHYPNDMWCKRPEGQLEKCAEASALRKAFPEENFLPTADEMEGKEVADAPIMNLPSSLKEEAINHATDAHLQEMGIDTAMPEEEAQEEIEPTEKPAEPPNDWDAVYDELAPGVNAARTPIELKMFLEENAELIDTMGAQGPLGIRAKWLKLLDAAQKRFKKSG